MEASFFLVRRKEKRVCDGCAGEKRVCRVIHDAGGFPSAVCGIKVCNNGGGDPNDDHSTMY